MMYLLAKTLLTAMVVAGVSELGKHYSMAAAVLASLPLTSILAFVWIYTETGDTEKIIPLSYDILWLLAPSAAFFLLLPWLLKSGVSFPLSLGLACAGTAAAYGAFLYIKRLVL